VLVNSAVRLHTFCLTPGRRKTTGTGNEDMCSSFVYLWTATSLKIKAHRYSETSVIDYPVTQCHIPEVRNPQTYVSGNKRTRMYVWCCCGMLRTQGFLVHADTFVLIVCDWPWAISRFGKRLHNHEIRTVMLFCGGLAAQRSPSTAVEDLLTAIAWDSWSAKIWPSIQQ